jgi:adiponectin receptor
LLATLWFLRALLSFHRTPGVEQLHYCDKWAVYIYYLAIINCFASSAIFHVCSNHSKEVHALWNELDYLGIVLVNWGSAIPSTYFAMYDSPKPCRYLHYVLICTFAAASANITLQAKFRQPTYRRRRVFLFAFLGISTFLPVLQGLQMYGFQELNRRMSLMSFVGLATWNLGGGVIYASRIPERWYPGSFDVFGSSHQIMHFLAVCGAHTGEQGFLGAFKYWASKES